MLLRYLPLALMGLCSGGVIVAGIFAFLTIISVYPRLVGKTKTHRHILLYETLIIVGGVVGNMVDSYEVPIRMGGFWLLGIFGLSAGVFVGCLVISLAETLKALPVMNQRIHLAMGIQYMILSIGLGKLLGSLFYFSGAMKGG